MGDRSGIAWTDAMASQRDGGIAWCDETWNMIRAVHHVSKKLGWYCQRISPGCKNCYAASMNGWRGNGVDYTVPALKDVEVFLDEKALAAPLHWRTARRIFVCSMTDLFGAWVPDEWIGRIIEIMGTTPQHTFQILTKRPERMRDFLTRIARPGGQLVTPLPNAWCGVSVEDQATADERIPLLLTTPAAVRWLSYEPGLARVDFDKWLSPCSYYCDHEQPYPSGHHAERSRLDWLVVGGESGPGARPFDLAWARSAIAQCRAAGVACFVKQMGSRPTSGDPYDFPDMWRFKDRKGADPSEWPEDLRVQEWPR